MLRVLALLLLVLPAALRAQPLAPVDALASAARGSDSQSVAARVALAQRLAGSAPDSAEALAARAVRLADDLGTAGLCADANGVLADVQTARGALDEAMEAYGRARECASGDPGREARAHAGLGMIYAMQGRYPMARDEYDRALSLRQATGDRAAVAETQGKLAALALDQDQPADAERFAREALATAGADAPIVVRIHLGEALRRLDRAPEALSTLQAALADASGAEQRADESAALSALARAASDLDRHEDARTFAIRAIRSAGDFPQARSEATRTLAVVLDASGDAGAFAALLRHLDVRDSVAAATSSRRLNAAQAAFGMREREREIDHLEMESEVQALALSRTRATVAAAILGALLLLGVAVGLWRQRQGQARRLREKERQVAHKEMLVREVHHRVKNSLQVVASLLHLQTRRLDSPEALGVVRDVGGRIRTLALVHEKLYEGDDLECIDARAFFDDLAGMLVSASALQPEAVRIETDVAPLALPAEVAIPLALATAELVANACEHAFPDGVGTVRLSLRAAHGVLILDVADDGVGGLLDLDASPSLGLRLVSDMARQLGGVADSLPSDRGTHVRIEAPLPAATPEASGAQTSGAEIPALSGDGASGALALPSPTSDAV